MIKWRLVAAVAVGLIGGLVPAQSASATAEEVFWLRFAQDADFRGLESKKTKPAKSTEVIRARKSAADSAQKRAIDLLHDVGAEYTSFWISNTIQVRGDAALRARLARLPEVARVEADRPVPMTVPVATSPAQASSEGVEWNVSKIRADRTWTEHGARGQGIVVANIDTGVQWDHPALAGQYRGQSGSGVDHDHNWFDPAQACPAAAPCDTDGHGTHTMGTMAGSGGIGVAPDVKWIAAKACEQTTCSAAHLLAAGQWMLAPTDLSGADPRPDLAPDIVNNSWGSIGYSEWYIDVLDSWVRAGIFPAFSVGNDGPACMTTGYPGGNGQAYASAAFDAEDVIAPFSSRGGDTSYTKPDLSAPGVDVRSAVPGGAYASYSGTSMASPHTAATVALMWSAMPSLRGMVDDTRVILDATAIRVQDTTCAYAADGSSNAVWGNGKLDAYAAVARARSGVIPPGSELPLQMGYNRTLPGTPGHWGYHSVDRDPATYWEVPAGLTEVGINYAFQGGRRTADKVVIQAPAGEPARSLTFAVRAAYAGLADYEDVVPARSYTFDPATGNQVTVSFPPAYGCCLSLHFTGGPQTVKIAEVRAFSGAGKNAALGRPAQGTAQQGYAPANSVDGDAATYWESHNHAFPQTLTVDLGGSCRIYQVELALPPAWGARTQTVSVEGSTDGVTFSKIVGPREHVFDPAAGNVVAVGFNMAAVRYVRLVFTGNTGWPAAQLAELRVLAA
ncbi:hypothetical protein GCM10022248_31540 [Nonomuraea soli]